MGQADDCLQSSSIISWGLSSIVSSVDSLDSGDGLTTGLELSHVVVASMMRYLTSENACCSLVVGLLQDDGYFPGSAGEQMLSSCLSLLGDEGWSLHEGGVQVGSQGPVDPILGVPARLQVCILLTDKHTLLRWS